LFTDGPGELLTKRPVLFGELTQAGVGGFQPLA